MGNTIASVFAAGVLATPALDAPAQGSKRSPFQPVDIAVPEPSGTVLQMVDAVPVTGQKSRILITVVGRFNPRSATETWSLREVDCIARRYRMHNVTLSRESLKENIGGPMRWSTPKSPTDLAIYQEACKQLIPMQP